MPYFVLSYRTAEGYVEKRAPYRAEHLQRAREAHARGELLLAGAFADPGEGALLIFRAPDRSTVEQFAQQDPYVTAGLIARWDVREWTVVIGNEPGEPGPPPPAPAGR